MNHRPPPRGRLGKFLILSNAQRRVFLLAAALLPLVRLSIVLSGFGRTREALRVLFRAHSNPSSPSVDASTTARLVRAAALYGGSGATCLPQSLVTWSLLRRQGIDAAFRIGTRRAPAMPGEDTQPGIEAHAWVEVAGVSMDVVNYAAGTDSFVPFVPIV